MGQLYIGQNMDKMAESSFRLCIDLASDKDLKIKCQEGLADVELLRGNVDKSFQQLDYVQENLAPDSLAKARIEARRSQGYIQQNDFSKASESYMNSMENLPRNRAIEKEDIEPLEKAKQQLLTFNEVAIDRKIALARKDADFKKENTAASPTGDLVKENLRIADLYEQKNSLADAANFISASKKAISENTDAATAAEVYKKSYDLNLKRGNMAAALADLELYFSAKEKANEELKNNLNEQIEIVKGQQQIDQLQSEYSLEEKDKELLQSQLQKQKIIIALLGILLAASLVFFYFLYKNVKAKRIANQRLLLKSLRTQMNPHFIFNALNSVNNFIAKNDEKAANKFLADFSRLMRKVLDYSQKDFIPFEEELELNELYLKLEHFRFRDKFSFTFDNQADVAGSDLQVPPMLIQPFIENAVWHGLRYKEGMGHLAVGVQAQGQHIVVTVKDNGIGRQRSKALKTDNQKKYNSTGLENVSRRIALINEIYDKKYEISVEDVDGNEADTGTLVTVKIPVTAHAAKFY
jgi:anti-sigma regulatory factor (Ser/Thr protein kinase)